MEPNPQLDELARKTIGAAIEVHRHLGPGYLESVYQEALAVELTERGIPYSQQAEITIEYKGRKIGKARLDLLFDRQLVVELKAVDQLMAIHKAQVISYLKATGLPLGLLINFNVEVLKQGIKRVVLT